MATPRVITACPMSVLIVKGGLKNVYAQLLLPLKSTEEHQHGGLPRMKTMPPNAFGHQ